jgi:hypothetical protein
MHSCVRADGAHVYTERARIRSDKARINANVVLPRADVVKTRLRGKSGRMGSSGR